MLARQRFSLPKDESAYEHNLVWSGSERCQSNDAGSDGDQRQVHGKANANAKAIEKPTAENRKERVWDRIYRIQKTKVRLGYMEILSIPKGEQAVTEPFFRDTLSG